MSAFDTLNKLLSKIPKHNGKGSVEKDAKVKDPPDKNVGKANK
ncbi:MAG: hypothetical protein QHH06_07685 [Clostridiales bacterium]|jgi:hypothetical protein|nr:hypothetical protein [Eubacteriales bacterium]MDH7566349.1 hypothetical protein [Clostridiales bacterium]